MKQQTQTTHDSLSNQATINLSNPMPPHFDIIIVGAGPAGVVAHGGPFHDLELCHRFYKILPAAPELAYSGA